MFNQLAHLPHLLELEFLATDTRTPLDYFICGQTYTYRVIVATRKAIRRLLPDCGVHPHVVTSAGLDYKLGRKEEAGKSYLCYSPCGSEDYVK